MTDIVTYCDINTCEDCPRYGDDCDGDKYLDRYPTMHEYAEGKRINPKLTELIARTDAIKTVIRMCAPICDNTNDVVKAIDALPSADAVDCTDFIEWLVDRVLDETIWEYNSVAYGEIICRKLEKLGVLEVTEEPSYYIRHIENNAKESDLVYRPSADSVQGEWVRHELWGNPWFTCSECNYHGRNDFNFCPNCGARMKGGDSE